MMDGGYGNIGNSSMKIFLELLSEEDRRTYEEYLKKEDSVAYHEFKEWLKEIDNGMEFYYIPNHY